MNRMRSIGGGQSTIVPGEYNDDQRSMITDMQTIHAAGPGGRFGNNINLNGVLAQAQPSPNALNSLEFKLG